MLIVEKLEGLAAQLDLHCQLGKSSDGLDEIHLFSHDMQVPLGTRGEEARKHSDNPGLSRAPADDAVGLTDVRGEAGAAAYCSGLARALEHRADEHLPLRDHYGLRRRDGAIRGEHCSEESRNFGTETRPPRASEGRRGRGKPNRTGVDRDATIN